MGTYKVGIIGAAADISSSHIDAVLSNPQFELKALCDINTAKLKRPLNANNVILLTDDYNELINNNHIDTIVICTPNKLHSSFAVEALQANKNVLCEKPMTVSIQQSNDILKAVQNSKGTFVVSYHFAFKPEVQQLKSILNKFGALRKFKFESSEHLFMGKSWNFEKYNGGVWPDWAPNALSVLAEILTEESTFEEFHIGKANFSSMYNLSIETKVLVELMLDKTPGELLIDWEGDKDKFIARTTLWDDKGNEILLNHANNSITVNGTEIWSGKDSRYIEVYNNFAQRIEKKTSNIQTGLFETRLIDAVFKKAEI